MAGFSRPASVALDIFNCDLLPSPAPHCQYQRYGFGSRLTKKVELLSFQYQRVQTGCGCGTRPAASSASPTSNYFPVDLRSQGGIVADRKNAIRIRQPMRFSTAPIFEIEHHRARIGGRPVPNPCDARRLRLVLWRAVSRGSVNRCTRIRSRPGITAEFHCPSTMELDGAAAEDGATEDGVRRCHRLRDQFSVQSNQYILSCAFQFHTASATQTKPRAEINTRTISGDARQSALELFGPQPHFRSSRARCSAPPQPKLPVGSATAARPQDRDSALAIRGAGSGRANVLGRRFNRRSADLDPRVASLPPPAPLPRADLRPQV